MEKPDSDKLVFDLLKERACMKQDVYQTSKNTFALLKDILKERCEELKEAIHKLDDRVKVEFVSKSEFECVVAIAGDRLVFQMHSNVFKIEESSTHWRTTYLREDDLRGYCGIINVYNFLNDSFKYKRYHDSGYLIGRLFVNRENHFFMQGKRQIGFLYKDFATVKITPEILKEVVNSLLLYVLNFDLLTPPYDTVKEASVGQIVEISGAMAIKTGKRLGFKFSADEDEIQARKK